MPKKISTDQVGTFSLCGFVPSVLSRDKSKADSNSKGLQVSDSGEKARLFLISDKGIQPDNSNNINSEKTQNRKWVSHSETLEHGGKSYKVNAGKSGIFTAIFHKIVEQLDISIEKWGRVFILRFDLHQKCHTTSNQRISRFRKNLSRKMERQYDIYEIGYVWVREHEKAKAQHYHWVLFLDGNQIRHSSKIMEIIRATWGRIDPKNHVPTIKKPFYFVDNEEIKKEAIYRISYLAKRRGKGRREKQVKDYSSSRLTPPKQDRGGV